MAHVRPDTETAVLTGGTTDRCKVEVGVRGDRDINVINTFYSGDKKLTLRLFADILLCIQFWLGSDLYSPGQESWPPDWSRARNRPGRPAPHSSCEVSVSN